MGAVVAALPRVCAGVDVCKGAGIAAADMVPGNTEAP